MNDILTSDRVCEIFDDCLFKKGEPTENHVAIEGIMANFGLHPDRLEIHKKEIMNMLKELPDQFMASGGGGWTFLNACNDKHGNMWSGMQQTMEKLFVLGIATGQAKWQLSREMWATMPGGMPYVIVLDRESG
jgi:hypothetical protein